MSYVRFGVEDSDVYIYQDIDFGLRCCGCRLKGPGIGMFDTRSRAEMIDHIDEHMRAGHVVPTFVALDLRAEIQECGDDSPGAMHREMDRRAGLVQRTAPEE